MRRAAWLRIAACLALAGAAARRKRTGPRQRASLTRQPPHTLAEGGAHVEQRIRADDGSVDIVSRGRTRLEFDKAHVVETYVRAPGIPSGSRFETIVWIDARRRIRQWRLRGDLAVMAQGLGGTRGSEVTRFSAFDSRIEITPPPAG